MNGTMLEHRARVDAVESLERSVMDQASTAELATRAPVSPWLKIMELLRINKPNKMLRDGNGQEERLLLSGEPSSAPIKPIDSAELDVKHLVEDPNRRPWKYLSRKEKGALKKAARTIKNADHQPNEVLHFTKADQTTSASKFTTYIPNTDSFVSDTKFAENWHRHGGEYSWSNPSVVKTDHEDSYYNDIMRKSPPPPRE